MFGNFSITGGRFFASMLMAGGRLAKANVLANEVEGTV
jgi:hypothetical protein